MDIVFFISLSVSEEIRLLFLPGVRKVAGGMRCYGSKDTQRKEPGKEKARFFADLSGPPPRFVRKVGDCQ